MPQWQGDERQALSRLGAPSRSPRYSGDMDVRALSIEGAWEFTPRFHRDDRGAFLEAFTAAALEEVSGRLFNLAQINTSISRRGVIRGIHAAHRPPGQAKYVTCVSGQVLDVVVDLRRGSPTFGRWDSLILNDTSRSAAFISEGLGHAFQALSDGAVVLYATSTPYDPDNEFGIDPLDPDLGIAWSSVDTTLMSPRDAAAPRLRDFIDALD